MNTHTQNWLLTLLVTAAYAACLPFAANAGDKSQALDFSKPFEQDFTLTAYYSPEPTQCCYVQGSYEADVTLNGGGIHGADGTPVYPGMAAAPSQYPYGTRINLPGVGIITVHDRGGAIVTGEKAHRLDIWMGSGEEGLARALAFGVRHVHGTVYPPSDPSAPSESLSLANFSAPLSMLQPFATASATLLDLHVAMGDVSASVTLLQQKLADLGYFHHAVTGTFGQTTLQSLQAFYAAMGLKQQASSLTETGAALLEAASDRQTVVPPFTGIIDAHATSANIAGAQRTLRFLGYYKGRTNGHYDSALRKAIIAYQKDHSLIGAASSPGAGRIGPKTAVLILRDWNNRLIAAKADALITEHRVLMIVAAQSDFGKFVGKGDSGDAVRSVQAFLAGHGYLSEGSISGFFGMLTEQALKTYQLAAGIIRQPTQTGAGFAGPATIAHLKQAEEKELLSKVRSEGWAAL